MFSIYRVYGFLSAHFRARRLQWFRFVISPTSGSSVLDVGGYPWIWLEAGLPLKVTLLNPHILPDLPAQFGDRFEFIVGDGCKLDYSDKRFDVVFSNSVIEHVGTYDQQRAFAAEARRVGVALWIQTPAREFFIEPHLLAPFFHFLPRSLQSRITRYGTVWGLLTKPNPAQVEDFINGIRLLSYAEMKELFPDCEILRERWLGFTKSYVAVRTLGPTSSRRP